MSPSTPASRYEAVTDILGGANTADVAEEHGVQESTVDRWVRENSEASEALDPRAREEHQAVREQNEAKPAEDDVLTPAARSRIDELERAIEDRALGLGAARGDDAVLAQTARSRIDELERTLEDLYAADYAPEGVARDQLLAEIGRAEAERDKLVALCTPNEDDPGDTFVGDDAGRWRAVNGCAPPSLARDANDPYPSSHGSLSATVNDLNY